MLTRLGIALAQSLQRRNRRIIDKTQMPTIQSHPSRIISRIKLIEKRRSRSKKQRAMQTIKLAAVSLQMLIGIQLTSLLPGKVERSDDDAAQHRSGQISEHSDGSHSNDHQHIIERYFVHHPQRRPGKSLLRHHKHHTHQRRQRNTLDQRRQKQNEQQNQHPSDNARQAPAPTGN